MLLSIIIPCYNEDQTIKPLLESLFLLDCPIKYEIIVVDDGSKRNLLDLINEYVLNKKVRFIRLPKNHGKGIAIRIGLKYAKGDIFIIQDADFEYFPTDIPKLLMPIVKNKTNIVYGTRFESLPAKMSKSHFLGNKLLTKLTNFLYKTELTDMETGYKMFTRNVITSFTLNAREFEFEPEFTAKSLEKGFRIIECPIKYKYRSFGEAKINFFDGLESALILFQNRLFQDSSFFDFCIRVFKFHLKKKLDKLINKFLKIITRRI